MKFQIFLSATTKITEIHEISPKFWTLFVTMCWSIWVVRSEAIFNDVPPSLHRCKIIFKKEFALVLLRAKDQRSTTPS